MDTSWLESNDRCGVSPSPGMEETLFARLNPRTATSFAACGTRAGDTDRSCRGGRRPIVSSPGVLGPGYGERAPNVAFSGPSLACSALTVSHGTLFPQHAP